MKGKLLLHLDSPETVRNITVKLEGVSFSRVPIPQDEEDRRRKRKERYALEIHKFLYHTQVVFPPKKVELAASSRQFTLPGGDHQFDFCFDIPATTECSDVKQPAPYSLSRLVIDSTGIDYARDATSHFRGQLPPALSDMNEICSVRYFLKATIHRTSMLKMNIRVYQPIIYISPDNFDPSIDANETRFARRQVSVWLEKPSEAQKQQALKMNQNPQQQRRGLLRSIFSSSNAQVPEAASLPLMLDMRFPNYFNPVKQLPIRLFVINLTDPKTFRGSPIIYLNELTFKLYATTDTRAQMYGKQHVHSLTLMSQLQMSINLPLSEFMPANVPGLNDVWEAELPQSLWEKVRIPDNVAPTFQTCNIKRSYAFEVIAALSTIPGAAPNYVSVVGDVKLLSGISPTAKDWIPQPPPSKVYPSSQSGTTSGQTAPSSEKEWIPQPPPSETYTESSAASGSTLGQSSEAFTGPATGSAPLVDVGAVPGDAPPSYSDVVEVGAPPRPPRPQGQAGTAPPSSAPPGGPIDQRRSYQQSNSYFSGLESFDPDSKH